MSGKPESNANVVTIEVASHDRVADRWRKQYFNKATGRWNQAQHGDTEIVHRRLVALGSNPSAEAVDEVIGNVSWTKLLCTSCWKYHRKLVRIGRNENDPKVCAECIKAAHDAAVAILAEVSP